jgi:hypothetical protein
MPDNNFDLKKYFTPIGNASSDDASKADSIRRAASALQVDPSDLATGVSYESSGTFDPWVKGPRTKWGQHRGLIQFGEPQQKTYGVHEGQSFDEQMTGSVVRYLKDHGVKPGMKFAQIYKAINGGNVNADDNTPDANTGRTIADNIRNAEKDHRPQVMKRFGQYFGASQDSLPDLDFGKIYSGIDKPGKKAKLPTTPEPTVPGTHTLANVPDGPMPEAPDTLNAQRQAANDPNSTRIGVLYTPGTTLPPADPSEFDIKLKDGQVVRTNQAKLAEYIKQTGTFLPDIQEGKVDFTPLLGGKAEPNTEPTADATAVITKDAKTGGELVASAVQDPGNVEKEAALQKQQFPNHQTTTQVVKGQHVIDQRKAAIQQPQQSEQSEQPIAQNAPSNEAASLIPPVQPSGMPPILQNPAQPNNADVNLIPPPPAQPGLLQNPAQPAKPAMSDEPVVGDDEEPALDENGQPAGKPQPYFRAEVDPDQVEPGQDVHEGVFKQAARQLGYQLYGRQLNDLETEALAEYQKQVRGGFVFQGDATGSSNKAIDPVKGAFYFTSDSVNEAKHFLDTIQPQLEQTRKMALARRIENMIDPDTGLDNKEVAQLAGMGFTPEELAAYIGGNTDDPLIRSAVEQRDANQQFFAGRVAQYKRELGSSSMVAKTMAYRDLGLADDKQVIKAIDTQNKADEAQREQVKQDLYAEAVSRANFVSRNNTERDIELSKIQISDEDVNRRLKELKEIGLTDDEKLSALETGEQQGQTLLGKMMAGFGGSGGGRILSSLAGVLSTVRTAPGLHDLYVELAKAGQYDQIVGETSAGHTFAGRVMNVIASTPADLSRYILLSKLPGGSFVGFGTANATETLGKGGTPFAAMKDFGEGFATAGLLAGASKLAQLATKSTFESWLSDYSKDALKAATPAEIEAIKTGAAQLDPAVRNAWIASKIVGEGTRVGSVFGGVKALSLARGRSDSESTDQALQFALFDLVMHHGEAATTALQNLSGKIFRFWKGGNSVDGYIDANGDIRKVDEKLPDGAIDYELVYDPENKTYSKQKIRFNENRAEKNITPQPVEIKGELPAYNEQPPTEPISNEPQTPISPQPAPMAETPLVSDQSTEVPNATSFIPSLTPEETAAIHKPVETGLQPPTLEAHIDKDGKFVFTEPEEEKPVHKFSSTQANLPTEQAQKVLSVGKSLIPESELYTDPEDPSFGREDKPHVTVKYGLHTNDGKEVSKILAGEKPFEAKLGKITIFPGGEDTPYDVVKADVESPELHKLNKLIADSTEVTDTHPEYKPHVTLAYVKKGEGEKYVGRTDLEGTPFPVNSIMFSAKDGNTLDIPLGVGKADKPAKPAKIRGQGLELEPKPGVEEKPATEIFQQGGTPAERRKAGEYKLEGVTIKRQAPLTEKESPKGDKGQVKFADNVEPDSSFRLVEADKLQPSHVGAQPNPYHFLPEAQPKNRTDKASTAASDSIAKSPNFREITEGYTAYAGAPVINDRGEVIQGNNRTIGLQKHYSLGGGQYKKDLIKNAEKFGFTPDQVEGMKSPVLVRQLENATDDNAIEYGNYDDLDITSGGNRRLDAHKTAARLSHDQKHKILDAVFLNADDEATLTDLVRGGQDKLYKQLEKVLTPTQLQSLTKDGKLTPEAVEDLKGLIQHFLFTGGDANLPELFEGLPYNGRRGLEASLPAIFSVPNEASLVGEIQNAIVAAQAFHQSEGKDFDTWMAQRDMFNGNIAPVDLYTATELALAAAVVGAKKIKDVKDKLTTYAKAANGSPATMFDEETKGISKADAVKQVFGVEHVEKANTEQDASADAEAADSEETGTQGLSEGGDETPSTEARADVAREPFTEVPKTFRHNGIVVDIAPIPESKIGERLAALQTEAILRVLNDPDGYIERYEKEISPRIVNSDEAKSLFPEYEEDRLANIQGVHEASSIIGKLVFETLIARLPKGSRVAATAGGAASGKTFAAGSYIDNDDLRADLVLDATLKDVNGNREYIDLIAGHGHEGVFVFVMREIDSAARSNVERSAREGRVVPYSILGKAHYQSRKAFADDTYEYATNKGFDVIFVENGGREKGLTELSYEEFKESVYNISEADFIAAAEKASFESYEEHREQLDPRIPSALRQEAVPLREGISESSEAGDNAEQSGGRSVDATSPRGSPDESTGELAGSPSGNVETGTQASEPASSSLEPQPPSKSDDFDDLFAQEFGDDAHAQIAEQQKKAELEEAGNALIGMFKPKKGSPVGQMSAIDTVDAIDEDQYLAAKPHFETAFQHLGQSDATPKETMLSVIRYLKNDLGADAATVLGMKPYIIRFAEDVEGGKISLPQGKNGSITKIDDEAKPANSTAIEQPESGDLRPDNELGGRKPVRPSDENPAGDLAGGQSDTSEGIRPAEQALAPANEPSAESGSGTGLESSPGKPTSADVRDTPDSGSSFTPSPEIT